MLYYHKFYKKKIKEKFEYENLQEVNFQLLIKIIRMIYKNCYIYYYILIQMIFNLHMCSLWNSSFIRHLTYPKLACNSLEANASIGNNLFVI